MDQGGILAWLDDNIVLLMLLLIVGVVLLLVAVIRFILREQQDEPISIEREHIHPDLTYLFSFIFVVTMAVIVTCVGIYSENLFIQIPIGMYLGFYVFLFVFPIIPGMLESLSNRPDDPDAHPGNPRYGFFVFLQQGRVIVVQRGKKFFRAMMDYATNMWYGERRNTLVPRQPRYWDVCPSGEVTELVYLSETRRRVGSDEIIEIKWGPEITETYPDSHPIPFPVKSLDDALRRWWWLLYFPLSINWWVWKRYVFDQFGAVFTGLYWFQAPLVHFMVYYKKTKNEKDEDVLELSRSWSNHFRVSEFEFHVVVPFADTQDQAQVRVGVTFILRVFNSHMTAYRSDGNFPGRVTSAVSAAITEYTRSKPMSEIQAAKDETDAKHFANHLKTIGDRTLMPVAPLCAIGIEVMDVQIFDISPSTPGLSESLSKFVISKIERKSSEELAIAAGAYIREAIAAAAGDPNAVAMAKIRADVEIAQAMANGKGTGSTFVNLGGGNQPTDPIAIAQLKILRDIAGDKK